MTKEEYIQELDLRIQVINDLIKKSCNDRYNGVLYAYEDALELAKQID